MSAISKKFRKLISKGMQIPIDVTLGLPRVTMIGQLHVYIENHQGILSFTPERVHLRLTDGELIVVGQNIIIKAILPEELILEGTIDEIKHV